MSTWYNNVVTAPERVIETIRSRIDECFIRGFDESYIRFTTVNEVWVEPARELSKESGETITLEFSSDYDDHLRFSQLTVNPDGTEDYTEHNRADDIKAGVEYFTVYKLPESEDPGGDWRASSLTTLLQLEDGRFLVEEKDGFLACGKVGIECADSIATCYGTDPTLAHEIWHKESAAKRNTGNDTAPF